MMARRLAILLTLLFAPSAVHAQSAHVQFASHFYYLNPDQIDLTLILPPPPSATSAQARSDEAQVAAAIAARNPAQVSEAQESSKRDVFFFQSSIGPGFTPARLPATAAFFSRVGSDVARLIDSAKSYWSRPRPSGVQKRRGSYPSGHAAFAASAAILLALLLPAKRDAIFSQARIFAENRILLGLHYPSDIAAGWTAGTLAAYVMMHDRRFQRDFAVVQAELRRANL